MEMKRGQPSLGFSPKNSDLNFIVWPAAVMDWSFHSFSRVERRWEAWSVQRRSRAWVDCAFVSGAVAKGWVSSAVRDSREVESQVLSCAMGSAEVGRVRKMRRVV